MDLRIPPPGHSNRLPRHIRKQRTSHRQNRLRRLFRTARSSQRDIRILRCRCRCRLAPATLQLLARDPQRHLGAVGRGDEGAVLLCGRQPRGDVAEGNGVGADPERRAPFFRDGFGQANKAGFGQGVVGLAAVYR